MTLSLFREPTRLLDEDLLVDIWPSWLSRDEADTALQTLLIEVAWQQPSMWMWGRRVQTPRSTAWFGEATYRYSGIVNEPQPLPPVLQGLRRKLSEFVGASFNSVLLNLYRNGDDYMSWHSDDEKELEPTIASVSLGATRRFVFRRRDAHDRQHSLSLEHGSLLVMKGATQEAWEHSVPKARGEIHPRINMTFRIVATK